MEIGLRASGAFLSINSEQDGVELENSEVIFTDQGLYLYKSYSNGHVYDTSKVWLSLFKTLLSPPYQVPSIILPRGFPTFSAYERLAKYVPPELTGGLLTWKADFYDENKIYLDFNIRQTKGGFDIILTPDCLPSLEAAIQGAEHDIDAGETPRSRSLVLQKDLAGLVYDHVVAAIVAHPDPEIREMKVLGRVVSAFVVQVMEGGGTDPKVLGAGLDFPRFVKGKKRYESLEKEPQNLGKAKESLIAKLSAVITEAISAWCTALDLDLFFQQHKEAFFKLRLWLQQQSEIGCARRKLHEMRQVMEELAATVPLSSFPVRYQLEVMRWIFKNEDRVWRYRGGRDGCETVEEFLSFVDTAAVPGSKTTKFPGVITFAVARKQRREGEKPPQDHPEDLFPLQNIIGYAVGEFVLLEKKPDTTRFDTSGYSRVKAGPGDRRGVTYEIVTAWVDQRFRGNSVSTDMYIEVMQRAPVVRRCGSILFDLKKGGLERVISTSWFFWTLAQLRLLPWIVRTRESSYTIDNTLTRQEEPFEQVILNAGILSWATFGLRVMQAARHRLLRWFPAWIRWNKGE